jgi:hypothetical protein
MLLLADTWNRKGRLTATLFLQNFGWGGTLAAIGLSLTEHKRILLLFSDLSRSALQGFEWDDWAGKMPTPQEF